MSTSNQSGPVTQAIAHLRAGESDTQRDDAKNAIANHFFEQLVGRLRTQFPNRSEDVVVHAAQSAFRLGLQHIENGRYERVGSRGELFNLLLKIAIRKAYNKVRDEKRQTKRLGELTDRLDETASHSPKVDGLEHLLLLYEKTNDDHSSPEWHAVLEAAAEYLGNWDAELRLAEILIWTIAKKSQEWIGKQIRRSPTTVGKRLDIIRSLMQREDQQ